MSRSEPGADPAERRLSEPEVVEFAQELADLFLSNKWYRKMILAGLDRELRRPDSLQFLLEEVRKTHELPSLPADKKFATKLSEAIKRRRRQGILHMLLDEFRKSPPTQGMADGMLQLAQQRVWRKELLQVAAKLKGARGRPTEVDPRDYSKLASFADADLAPLIEKILDAQDAGTKHSVTEMLEFWSKDHPKSGAFLLRHVELFETALRNTKLLERGKKIGTRARLLAGALAGADRRLKLWTSVARVAQGRRELKRKHTT